MKFTSITKQFHNINTILQYNFAHISIEASVETQVEQRHISGTTDKHKL